MNTVMIVDFQSTDTWIGLCLILAVLFVGTMLLWSEDRKHLSAQRNINIKLRADNYSLQRELARLENDNHAFDTMVDKSTGKREIVLAGSTDMHAYLLDSLTAGALYGHATLQDDGTILVTEVWPEDETVPDLIEQAETSDEDGHVHGDWDQGGYCNKLMIRNGDTDVCAFQRTYDDTRTVHGKPLTKPVVSVFEAGTDPQYYGD